MAKVNCKYISWKHGVEGYLSDYENAKLGQIKTLLNYIQKHGYNITVEITIEKGDQFHIYKDGKIVSGYNNINQCLDILCGAFMAIEERR